MLRPACQSVSIGLLAGLALIGGSDLLHAQDSLVLSSSTAIDSGSTSLGLSLSVSGTAPAGLQFTIPYDSSQIARISAAPGPAASAAGKNTICTAGLGQYTCLITGLNTNTMATGVVANLQVTLSAGATTNSLSLSNVLGVDPSANPLTVSPSGPAVITVPTISGVSCTPNSVNPGQTAGCTLTLTSAAPSGGAPVAVTSNNPLLYAPPTVVVSAGAATASFSVTAGSVISSNQSATLNGSLDSATKDTTLLLQAGSTAQPRVLTLVPSSVSLSVASAHSASQTVSITSPVASDQFLTAVSAAGGGGNWLSVSPASGSLNPQATITVNVNAIGLTDGTYSGDVSITAASGATASLQVTITVTSSAPLTVLPSTVSFTYDPSNPVVPDPQNVSVFSNPTGAALAIAVAEDQGSWLTIGGETASAAPASFFVRVNPVNLAPGVYNAQIAVTSPLYAVQIPVTLTVLGSAPQLSVSSGTQSFALLQGSSAVNGEIVVQNTGGGNLQFSAQAVTSQDSWLNLKGGDPGSASSAEPGVVGFSVDPTGLVPGVYTGQITVADTASNNSSVTRVIAAVAQTASALTTSQTGLTFNAVAGGPSPPTQSFLVTAQGAAPSGLSAQVQLVPNPKLSRTAWLNATTSPADSTGNTEVTVAPDAGSLMPGQYYGSVQIQASNAANSPLSVSVLLNVLPASGASPGVQLSTSGLIFSSTAGSKGSQQQEISLFNPLNTPVTWSALVSTPDSAPWLSLAQLSGTLMPGSSTIAVQADFSDLIAPGLQAGTISLAFSDGSAAAVQVQAVSMQSDPNTAAALSPKVTPRRTHAGNLSAGCVGGQAEVLIPFFQQPVSFSVEQTSVAQTVRVYAVDDCGQAVSQANGDTVQVIFSDNDSSINLQDTGNGVWEATWVPQNTGTAVTLSAVAYRSSAALTSLTNPVSVVVQGSGSGLAPQIYEVVNAAIGTQATPQVVAPGSYVTIYGMNLSSPGSASASATPLPSSLNGTQLMLGGEAMPVLYASPTQVNAFIPQSLGVNTQYQLTVLQGSAQSVPIPLTLTNLQPGIYSVDASGSGQGVVEIAGTNLIAGPSGNGSRPVLSGSEYLIAYCTGLGIVQGSNREPPPSDGFPAPSGVLYQTTAQITATLGDVNLPVTFAGLTPTLVGVYQVNLQIPAGVPTGDAVPLVLSAIDPQSGMVTPSNTVTVAVE